MKLPRRQGSSSESSQGFASSHIVATTPASSRAAQRNSPRVTGLARSADGIFFSERRKGTMSGKPVAIKLGDLVTNAKGGKYFPISSEEGGPAVWQPAEWLRILWHPSAYNGEENSEGAPLRTPPGRARWTPPGRARWGTSVAPWCLGGHPQTRPTGSPGGSPLGLEYVLADHVGGTGLLASWT